MLTGKELLVLRSLFADAYIEPNLVNAKYRHSDLQERARAVEPSPQIASEIVDALISKKMLTRGRSTSGLYVEYALTRAGVNYLASQNVATLKARSLSEDERQILVNLLSESESALATVDATNAEKAMARAFIVAAKTLSEAPEPPSDIIWELVNRASQIAGIASLLVSVFALFAAAGR